MKSIVYKPGGKKMKQTILSNLKQAGNREEKKKDKKHSKQKTQED